MQICIIGPNPLIVEKFLRQPDDPYGVNMAMASYGLISRDLISMAMRLDIYGHMKRLDIYSYGLISRVVCLKSDFCDYVSVIDICKKPILFIALLIFQKLKNAQWVFI